MIPLVCNRANGAVYSKINFNFEICSAYSIVVVVLLSTYSSLSVGGGEEGSLFLFVNATKGGRVMMGVLKRRFCVDMIGGKEIYLF